MPCWMQLNPWLQPMLCRFFFFALGIFNLQEFFRKHQAFDKVSFHKYLHHVKQDCLYDWISGISCTILAWLHLNHMAKQACLSFPVLFYEGVAAHLGKVHPVYKLQTGMSTQTGKHLLFRTCRAVTEVSRSCTGWTLWTFKGQLISFQGSFDGLIINRVVLWLIVTVHKDGRSHHDVTRWFADSHSEGFTISTILSSNSILELDDSIFGWVGCS